MRELLTNLVLVSSLLPVAAGGMQIAAILAEPNSPHAFADLDGQSLWSSEVRRVDPSQQAYERVPAVVPGTMVAEAKPAELVRLTLGASQTSAEAANRQPAPNVMPEDLRSAAALDWCGTRYRSYNSSDNTYQPYGGGPRRNCQAPTEVQTAPVQQIADVGGAVQPDANARWCMERYSSYRIEDNTYQPFTGRRKQCAGPASQSASNSVAIGGGSSVVQF